jgi:hypothetical protein
MNDLQEGEMNSTGREPLKEHEDLFLVRARIAEDRDRARTEQLARQARGPGRDGGRASRPLAWLGRRLVAVGSILADDPAPGAHSRSTSRPC